ncbi:hypothetical protein POTOM_007879 [Populus tomentosa]|uniref:Uncharacterized protein n=1 Tax=Populus tomentosa TaxID=118781 RepID=A0A8X8AGA2_POPTO|nr:hypothetical protein POTOM_007879 [Populus tomentosa]
MASSNSITEPSPEFQLPTRRSIMAEAEAASPAPEWLSTRSAALSNFQKIVAELLGTYILVFVGCGAALTDKVQRLNMLRIAIEPMHILAQVLGSTLASLTLRLLFHEQGNIQPIVNQYSDPTSDLEAIVWEFIITFILMFTICGVATEPQANLWVYIVSPILGAMAAAAVYSVLRVPEPAKPEDTNKSTYNNLTLHAEP